MASLIVVYATTEGHTRIIAERIGEWIRASGHTAVVVDSESVMPGLLEENEHDGAIFCGPVHQGKHSPFLAKVIRENLPDLQRIPSALVSVSLSAALADPKDQEEARSYADDLIEETGWRPSMVEHVGGALLYTQYDFMKRMMVRLIAGKRRSETDSSRDWEFTDWEALQDFVKQFLATVRAGQRT